MTTITAESAPAIANPVSWRDSTWHIRWVVIGIGFLVAWRCSFLIDKSWLPPSAFPFVYYGLAIGTQAVFLLLPIATRDQGGFRRLSWPPVGRYFWEALLAVGVLVLIVIAMWLAEFALRVFSPGQTMEPEAYSRLAQQPNLAFVVPFLIYSFTLAPLGEELFFRGFLHNALRAQMPFAAAVILQAGLFGFMHPYSLAHSICAALGGVVLTLLYEWRRTLLTPILVHMGVNFVAALGVVIVMTQSANMPVLGVIVEPKAERCVVASTVPGCAAEKAGLQAGDVIIGLDDRPIVHFQHLTQVLQRYRVGNEITLSVERAGEIQKLRATLQPRGTLTPAPQP